MERKLELSPGICILGALCLLVLPLRWAMGILAAILTHELSHCAAVLICGGKLYSLSIGTKGARIEAAPLSRGKSLFCALAGPLGSFSLLMLSERFPEAALAGLIQGLYNLLPVYPLDGGRVLRLLLPEPVCLGMEAFFLILGTGFCLWLSVFSADLALISAISLWWPLIQRKFSCKDRKLAVQ